MAFEYDHNDVLRLAKQIDTDPDLQGSHDQLLARDILLSPPPSSIQFGPEPPQYKGGKQYLIVERDDVHTFAYVENEKQLSIGNNPKVITLDDLAQESRLPYGLQHRFIIDITPKKGQVPMSTNDVPGSNPVNKDVLASGCWAEHDDGSLIFVKGTENGQVVYEIYDVAQATPVYYQDSMSESNFKQQFSWKPGDADVLGGKWLWHDKTPFPWSRVIKAVQSPKPEMTSAEDILSAAGKVAESLKLRAQQLKDSDVEAKTDTVVKVGKTIMDRFKKAVDAFVE